MANIFVDGKLGKFNQTNDPAGTPPFDWNVTKDALAVLGFESEKPIEGDGSFKFSTKSIFNDNYALAFEDQGNVLAFGQGFEDKIIIDFNKNEDFTIELRHYLTEFSNRPDLFTINISGDQFIRITTNSNGTYFVQWFAPTEENTGRRIVINDGITGFNQWKHLILSFQQNVGVRLYVNGTKKENTENAYIGNGSEEIEKITYYLGLTAGKNPVGYGRGIRVFQGYAANDADASSLYNSEPKIIQPIPLNMQPYLIREFLLNQEQGRNVNESSNLNIDSMLNEFNPAFGGYKNEDVQFGGGAWVDVSAIN